MKSTVSEHDFCQAFVDHNRTESFSYDARKAIFEYLEQMEEDCDTEFELDPIAICCEYSEHDSALGCIEDNGYGFEPDAEGDDDDIEAECLEYLQDRTTVIEFNGGIVIQSF